MDYIFTKEFWMAALVRGIRTFAESVLAYLGTGAVGLLQVNWLAALSAGAMGFVMAILLAVANGLPEVKEKELKPPEDEDDFSVY